MKWWEILLTISGIIGLLWGVNWILTSLGFEETIGDLLTFLISIILVILIAVIIIQTQQKKDIEKIKKKLHIKEEKNFIEKMKKKKSRRGAFYMDPRILFWILLGILLYLLLKALGVFK